MCNADFWNLDRTVYPTPNFQPEEVVNEAVNNFIQELCEQEKENAAFFNNRRMIAEDAVNRFYRGALNRFAGFWNNDERFQEDIQLVLRKWDLLLGHHDFTAYQRANEKGEELISRIEVAESVYQGRGFTQNRNLVGNPFCDMALLIAMQNCQKNALEFFDTHYKNRLRNLGNIWARKNNQRLIYLFPPEGDWWECFKAWIICKDGDQVQQGGLCAYRGDSGLIGYARQSCCGFFSGWLRSEFGVQRKSKRKNGRETDDEQTPKERTFKDPTMWARLDFKNIKSKFMWGANKKDKISSVDRAYWANELQKVYNAAFENMSSEQRTALKLRCALGCDGKPVKNQEVARILETGEGNASRYWSRALKKIDQKIAEKWGDENDKAKGLRRVDIFYFLPGKRVDGTKGRITNTVVQVNEKTQELLEYLNESEYGDLRKLLNGMEIEVRNKQTEYSQGERGKEKEGA